MKKNCPICTIKMFNDGPTRFCKNCDFRTFKVINDIIEYKKYENYVIYIRYNKSSIIWKMFSTSKNPSHREYSGNNFIPYFSTEEQILNYLIML